ncbi:ASCH domain-containing protein [Pseudomonas tohonis]|uniref:hypothetical protein n=1 Tax=Pseudomonas tohonis TaxID=2725477 RepID=UPI0021DAA11E|nr:hypothetical protein [Pseudomonas tohonis]UXY55348.1 hypothetical protein N9L84_12490 [Pseudomonas tohonis]
MPKAQQPRDIPMPFKAQMVRGVLNDLKWVTRRPVKGAAAKWLIDFTSDFVASKANDLCPYGQPGDRLWVREAWATHACLDKVPPRDLVFQDVIYLADGQPRKGKYRPAMYMPRWASRILLEVTAVRVERLQDITEDQAIAEGILRDGEGWRGYEGGPWFASPIGAFRSLWENIHGDGSWDANDYVWVIEFRRLQPGAAGAGAA